MTLVEATGLAIAGRLEHTDLQLDAGTITCLLGPNGSGKTSLLHALARIGEAQGRVRVDGRDLDAQPPSVRRQLLSFLPASRDLTWPISGRDLVALSGAAEEEVAHVIDRLELAALAPRRADLLSTGERSRVLIARALAPRPRLLLLDEPGANLDPLWQLRLAELLREEVRRDHCAAVVAMHDLDAAARMADRLIMLKDRSIAADGGPELIEGAATAAVFGIERAPSGWRPAAVSPSADR